MKKLLSILLTLTMAVSLCLVPGVALAGTEVDVTTNVEDVISIDISPASLNFETLFPGQTSDPQILTLLNTGSINAFASAYATGEAASVEFYNANMELTNYYKGGLLSMRHLWPGEEPFGTWEVVGVSGHWVDGTFDSMLHWGGYAYLDNDPLNTDIQVVIAVPQGTTVGTYSTKIIFTAQKFHTGM